MLDQNLNKQTCTNDLQTKTLGTFDLQWQLELSNMHHLSQ